ncbi:hypothetical protein [Saccharospirillum mangrovi]|uniref:hypothetical protein n=1 Tax=Saccharospirillum mangrovi TaxID=2161747 RepID=UPI000D394AE7|nr:hypothetical protein [Saccharospirillum mangrovi]
MIPTNEYSCTPRKNTALNITFEMDAFKRGEDKHITLSGISIEAEYKVGGHTLLITKYDSFNSVKYWFNLLDEDLNLVDEASTPEYFGFIQNLKSHSGNLITFGFYGTEDKWALRYTPEGVRRFRFSRPLTLVFKKRFITIKKL